MKNKISKILVKWNMPTRQVAINELEALIHEEKKKVFRYAIDLSDKIELQAGHTEFEEWRAFKHFRNNLRDKFKKYDENK